MSAWSPLFPLLGFLMPEVGGGVLSHGGVITRELGITASSSDQVPLTLARNVSSGAAKERAALLCPARCTMASTGEAATAAAATGAARARRRL